MLIYFSWNNKWNRMNYTHKIKKGSEKNEKQNKSTKHNSRYIFVKISESNALITVHPFWGNCCHVYPIGNTRNPLCNKQQIYSVISILADNSYNGIFYKATNIWRARIILPQARKCISAAQLFLYTSWFFTDLWLLYTVFVIFITLYWLSMKCNQHTSRSTKSP